MVRSSTWFTERPRPARVRDWPHAWKLAVATVCFGAFMGQLDASIVTLTYRPLEKQFHEGAAGVQWVSLSYLLTLVCLLVPIGRQSDQKGRKLSYLRGFVVFTIGSAACGAAPDLAFLVVARVVQGVGAALLQANSVALVTNVAPRPRLRAVLGIQAGAQALGLALGPTAGGLIVSTIGWRWVFAVNIPIGLFAIVSGVLFLPRTTERAHPTSLDGLGALYLAGAAGALLLTFSVAGGLSLPLPLTALSASVAVFAAAALIRHQRSAPTPLLEAAMLRAPGVAGGLVTAMFSYLSLFGPLVLVPAVFSQEGISSLRSGLVLTALPAGFAIAATIGGGILPRRWDDRTRSIAGIALACVALGAALVVPLRPSWLVGVLAAEGFGLGVLAPANNASVMRAVASRASASAGALLNMTRALGTALGISAVTVALHLGGGRLAMAVLLAASLLGLASAWANRAVADPAPGPIMPDHVLPVPRARMGARVTGSG